MTKESTRRTWITRQNACRSRNALFLGVIQFVTRIVCNITNSNYEKERVCENCRKRSWKSHASFSVKMSGVPKTLKNSRSRVDDASKIFTRRIKLVERHSKFFGHASKSVCVVLGTNPIFRFYSLPWEARQRRSALINSVYTIAWNETRSLTVSNF